MSMLPSLNLKTNIPRLAVVGTILSLLFALSVCVLYECGNNDTSDGFRYFMYILCGICIFLMVGTMTVVLPFAISQLDKIQLQPSSIILGTVLFQVLCLVVLSLSALALVLVDDEKSENRRVQAGKGFGWIGMIMFFVSLSIVLCDIFPPQQTQKLIDSMLKNQPVVQPVATTQ